MADFKDTNFEAIDKAGAKLLLDTLPEFEPTVDVVDSEYQLGDRMFSDDDGESTSVATREPEPKREVIPVKIAESFEEDFNDSRQNLRELSARQEEIMSNLFKLCKASDSPRAYEVLGQMIDRFMTIEDKMLDLYVKKAKFEKENSTITPPTQNAATINNNQYNISMTTAEILQQLTAADDENKDAE